MTEETDKFIELSELEDDADYIRTVSYQYSGRAKYSKTILF
jgi:hypothetical protein